jgi:cytochrome c2
MNRIPLFATAILLLIALLHRAMAEPANAARGERMYRACVACHSLEPDRNMTGPSLAEVWNRKAGSLASFPGRSPNANNITPKAMVAPAASAMISDFEIRLRSIGVRSAASKSTR